MHAAAECLNLFRKELKLCVLQSGHHTPVMPSPSLYHHEQVEGMAVQAVVCLEVPSGVFHETFNLAGQQHFSEHRTVVVSRFVRGMVAYGEGYVRVMVSEQFHP